MIEGGHLAAAGIKGTTSVSILTGQVGIAQAVQRNPMRGIDDWRLWLLDAANSQDHGEATVTDLVPEKSGNAVLKGLDGIQGKNNYKSKPMRYSLTAVI